MFPSGSHVTFSYAATFLFFSDVLHFLLLIFLLILNKRHHVHHVERKLSLLLFMLEAQLAFLYLVFSVAHQTCHDTLFEDLSYNRVLRRV